MPEPYPVPSSQPAASGALPSLGLYVHIPWCERKCPYCDFNSHAVSERIPQRAYLQALLRDLDHDLPLVAGRAVGSIFIGGGTPSLLAAETVRDLLEGVGARLGWAADIEITLEANPGTVEQGRFAELRAAGINRLSIGVQSFDDRLLRAIGRIHDGAEARRAAEAAHAAGFVNLNLDLMCGLPGQAVAQARRDAEVAVALGPGHVSHYQLTLEPNTALYQDPPGLPDEDALEPMQEGAQGVLCAAGYGQYEVSSFARAGRQCRHNLNYWRFGDYLGMGAGAHAKLTDPASGSITRTSKQRHPERYLRTAGQSAGISSSRVLGREDIVLEFMMNALRLNEGFDEPTFTARTGLPLEAAAEPLRRAQALGLLEWTGCRARATAQGRHFLNDLLALFLPETP